MKSTIDIDDPQLLVLPRTPLALEVYAARQRGRTAR
jgi:hypothetical protein